MIKNNRLRGAETWKHVIPPSVFLLFLALVGLLVHIFSDNLLYHVGFFILVATVAVLTAKIDLAHPYTWFIPVFSLYSLSAPVALLFMPESLVKSFEGSEYAAAAMLIQYVALLGFLAGSLPRQKQSAVLTLNGQRVLWVDKLFLFLRVGAIPLLLVSWTLSGLFILYVFQSGYSTKMEFAKSTQLLGKTQFSFSFLLLSVFIILVGRKYRERKGVFIIWLAAGFWFGLAAFIASERDLLVRFFLISILIYHLFIRRINLYKLLLGGLCIIVLLGFMGSYRAAKHLPGGRISAAAVLVQSLFGEFSSSSQNLMVLLKGFESGGIEHMRGQTFRNDLIQQVTTSSMLTERGTRQNASAWFNKTFFSDLYLKVGGGRGFSLAGEGYLNFGIPGVFGLFFLISFSLNMLYKRIHTLTNALIYVLIIPGVLYAIRMDMATLFSHTLKQVVFPVALLAIVTMVIVQPSLRSSYKLKKI